MEEHWRLLGISGCTTCLAPAKAPACAEPQVLYRLRSFRRAIDAVVRARAEAAKGRGHKEAALAILQLEHLLDVHLNLYNPFFELPHVNFNCFPMDRLHGMCVYTPTHIMYTHCRQTRTHSDTFLHTRTHTHLHSHTHTHTTRPHSHSHHLLASNNTPFACYRPVALCACARPDDGAVSWALSPSC